MDKVNWEIFKYTFELQTEDMVKAEMIANTLTWFDTQPDWVSSKVWGLALGLKG